MSSEKENSEVQNSNQDKQPSVPVSDAEVKSDESSQPEVPKEPEVELSPEEKLQKELEEKTKEITSLKDKLLRQQAQASNDKKRYKADADRSAFDAKKRFLKKILDIRDNIDRALASFNKEDETQKVHFDGIQLIAHQFDDMFSFENIKPIEAKGEMYDLTKHEIVARVPYDGPENRVIDVIQKGYSMDGKLLRTAKVAISMKKPKETPAEQPKEAVNESAAEKEPKTE